MQSDPRQRQPGVEEAEPVDADPAGSVQQSTPDPSVLPEPVDAEDQDASSEVEQRGAWIRCVVTEIPTPIRDQAMRT
jgi:hypothetical protein